MNRPSVHRAGGEGTDADDEDVGEGGRWNTVLHAAESLNSTSQHCPPPSTCPSPSDSRVTQHKRPLHVMAAMRPREEGEEEVPVGVHVPRVRMRPSAPPPCSTTHIRTGTPQEAASNMCNLESRSC